MQVSCQYQVASTMQAKAKASGRIRRVKCDEAKPSCRRCTSTGRKCDGYAPLVACTTTAPTISTPTLQISLTIDLHCQPLEKRTFQFFRQRTAPCVSGYFTDSVWEQLILQISHTEPVVRNAVTAVGALHEERMLRRTARGRGIDVGTDLPLRYYCKALNGLQTLLKSDGLQMNVVLVTSLLLVHFEALREAYVDTLIHLDNAVRLLNAPARYTQSVEPGLVDAFHRIDLQGCMFLGSRVPGFIDTTCDNPLPEAFTNLTHARKVVGDCVSHFLHFMKTVANPINSDEAYNVGVPLEVLAKSMHFAEVFDELDRLLLKLLREHTFKPNTQAHKGLSMLRTRVKINHIEASTLMYFEQTMLDAYLADFEQILATCNQVIASDSASQEDCHLHSVTLDESLLFTLQYLAVNCRDSRLRHSALQALKDLPGKEGLWHVEAMIRQAEEIITYEEAQCGMDWPRCVDVPEWRRVKVAVREGQTDWGNVSILAHPCVMSNGPDGWFVRGDS